MGIRNAKHILILSLTILVSCGKASLDDLRESLSDSPSTEPTEEYSLKGVLSSSFAGGSGIVTQAGGLGQIAYGKSVLVDNSGSIFVGGYYYSTDSYSPDMTIWKFNQDGSPDTSFGGGDGVFSHSINPSETINAMAIDSNGYIILVGTTFVSGNSDELAVWKVTPTGALDTSFGGGNGYVIHGNAAGGNGYDEGNAVAIDSNDNIIVVGRSNGSTGTKAAIWKYTSNGVLDTSFGGGDGFITTTSNGVKTGVVIDSADNIYVTGYAGGEVTLWKYNTTGTLDSSFDSDGIFVFTNPGSDYSYDLVLDQTGNILLTGDLSDGSNSDMFIMRVTPLGNLDTTFGAGLGYITHNNAAGGNGYDSGKAINLDSEGNILIAGSSYDSSYDLAIWKVSPQGQLDTSFGGGNGYVTLNNIAGGNSGDRGEDLALTASGTLVVTGFSVGTTTDEMFLLNLE
tara:strand:+ start:3988 stop:5349 length:1362 start_codon:yes stop_codon:yes gene_type:complete